MRTIRLAASLAAVAFAALARPAAAQEPMRPGAYRFTERVAGNPPIVLEGDITFTGDSLWVRAVWADCTWSPRSTKSVLRYDCDRTVLRFDRLDPLRWASYETPVTVLERVEVCEQYAGVPGGRGVCVKARRDVVEREVTREGRINPKRLGG